MNQKPQIRYLICSSSRVGSNLLFSLLENAGVARPGPHERIRIRIREIREANWNETDLKGFIEGVFRSRSTSLGVSGFKIHWNQLEDLVRAVNKTDKYKGMSVWQAKPFFPSDLKYIHLARADKVRQAVSRLKARQTNLWDLRKEDKRAFPENPVLDLERLDRLVVQSKREDRNWKKFFKKNRISPLELKYEEITGDYRGTVTGILKYLGAPVPDDLTIETDTIKMSDGLSEEWVRKYRERAMRKKISLYCKRMVIKIKEGLAS
ncbi:MAG: Stf0 family sulfotransferase [bacterium]